MSYYLCGVMNITNTGWQHEYAEAMPELLAKHSGEIVVSGQPTHFEGVNSLPDRLVLLRFSSEANAKDWYSDPVNKKLVNLRQTGSTFELLGINATQQ